MAKLEFTSNALPTIGVELELGIVHAETFQLEIGPYVAVAEAALAV